MKNLNITDIGRDVRVRPSASGDSARYAGCWAKIISVAAGLTLALVRIDDTEVYLLATDLERGRWVRRWEPEGDLDDGSKHHGS